MADTTRVEVLGLTNALADIIIRTNEEELLELGIEKAKGRNLKNIDKEKFFQIIAGKEKEICYAGSPANTIINLAFMGASTALLGSLGNDKLGNDYRNYLNNLGVLPLLGEVPGKTGLCYVLLTPDNERTSITDLGVATSFQFPLYTIKDAGILHTSGYEIISNPAKALETLAYADSIGAKISLDLADAKIIRKDRDFIEKSVAYADIIFMTEEEASEFFLCPAQNALEKMSLRTEITVLKKGSRGSSIRKGSEQYDIPAFPVKLISTCGAGDAYASGFLYGYLKNYSLQESGILASRIASRVCGLRESHLTERELQKSEKSNLLSV